jgi:hypothetical protein
MPLNIATPPRTDRIARILALIALYSQPDAMIRTRLGS